MLRTSPRLSALLLATIVSAAALSAVAAPPGDSLATRLAALRGEVESLSEQLRLLTNDRRERRSAAAARRAELEAEQRREALRLARLQAERERLQTEVKAATEREAALLPLVHKTLDQIDAQMVSGMPFRQTERRAEVQGLRDQLDASTLSPRQALLRAWSLMQDELKLTQQSALHRQTLTVEGEEVLADVVRLGMATLFFSTPDGRVGSVASRHGVWTVEVITEEHRRQAIEALFDAHKKQLRTGFFPMPLPPLEQVVLEAPEASKASSAEGAQP